MILSSIITNNLFVFSIVVVILIMIGLFLMSNVKTAKFGNFLSAFATFIAVVFTLIELDVMQSDLVLYTILGSVLIGSSIGIFFSQKVKMIQMPELVALLNGLGGAASGIVGAATLYTATSDFEVFTAMLALVIGIVTLMGSLIAAGKLANIIDGRPVVLRAHQVYTISAVVLIVIGLILGLIIELPILIVILTLVILASLFGWFFAIRVGGADMPITISLLNSLSGVAAAIAGMAVGNVLLVAVGGVVGASGLVLTQIMCRAMNRKLSDILFASPSTQQIDTPTLQKTISHKNIQDLSKNLIEAESIIIVPGYGMALSQAQFLVKQLGDELVSLGKQVKYAIHPVAGRMPGHMNVLLAEADISYESLCEMEIVNSKFSDTDLVIVVGANDVVNPAANTAVGTPIYQMPILNIEAARHIIFCNYDTAPGYAGVNNPLYESDQTTLLLGDAKASLEKIIRTLKSKKGSSLDNTLGETLKSAQSVIFVPGYGMALSQSQHLVNQLANLLTNDGKDVKFAIHPVAGRMPGHMNVLLAEADVSYEQLFSLEEVNHYFATTDVVIVVGANDVINPAAKTAVNTGIYQMPILEVSEAQSIIICNFDTSPGYSGVDNLLYTSEKSTLLLGDAKASLQKLIDDYLR